jgi:hypothetical protein
MPRPPRLASRSCGLLIAGLLIAGLGTLPAAEPPRDYGGRYPHLAVSNAQGECGIGAVVPWAGRLWFLTYGPHLPLGSDDGLYEVDAALAITRRPESVGGTPAARLIHRETNQLLIGPYLVDAGGAVHAVPPKQMEGRLSAAARHLTEPARKAYVYDMEGLLYELDLRSFEPRRLFSRAVPGWHGKGAYSGQGVLVVANNGEHAAGTVNKFEPFLYAVPNTRASKDEAGVLAEWDGTEWRLIRRRQFTDVTGPGGIHGPPTADAPLWAIGWDEKSVLLLVRSAADAAAGREPWHTFRLPIACASYTGDHGWHTEWPRIREVVPAAAGQPPRYILTMHGSWCELPAGFSAENPTGLRPLSSHLKITGDVAAWQMLGREQIVFGCDDTAKSGFLTALQNSRNDLNGRSNSNLWFTTWEGLRMLGRPGGVAYLWRQEPVTAGMPSDPLLLAGGPGGYDSRVVHLAHTAAEPVTFTLSAGSGTDWREVATVTVPPRGAAFQVLAADVAGDWIRVAADRDLPEATAVFRYGTRGGQVADPGLFAPLADAASTEPWIGGVVRSAAGAELPLDVLATPVAGDKAGDSEAWRIGLDGSRIALPVPLAAGDPKAAFLRDKAVPTTPDVTFDAASVIWREGERVFRLPKPLDPAVAAAYEQPFATGWPRGLREVVTERSLLNAAGTFYVLPRTTSGGAAKMQPVGSHGKRITDFCSWRGLLVLAGVREAARNHPRVIGGGGDDRPVGGPALWVGDIDELWKLPKPTGRGGPWHDSAVEAGQASDPYLMAGYDKKRLELSHDQAQPLAVTIEIDPAGDGQWLPYAVLAVPPGDKLEHAFPAGFSAHWIRFMAAATCRATATLVYE